MTRLDLASTALSRLARPAAIALSLLIVTRPVASQQATAAPPPGAPPMGAQEIAKQLANPLTNMVSIPFQFNWANGVGPNDETRFVLNIQPVVPMNLNNDWKLVARWIMPYVAQPTSLNSASGFSDIVASAFLSPNRNSKVTWGLGPVLSLPTTTNPALGSGKWSAGPTAAIMSQQGAWTYAFLYNQIWSFARAGAEHRDAVNQGFFQPVVTHSSRSGVSVTLMAEASANWDAPLASDVWSIPVTLTVGKITRFGPFPMNISGGGGIYAARTGNGPEWQLRTAFTLILPKGR